jgi:hypothetical protein
MLVTYTFNAKKTAKSRIEDFCHAPVRTGSSGNGGNRDQGEVREKSEM